MSKLQEPHQWNDDVVREYLTATAQEKNDPEKFYKTHLDVDAIHAESLVGRYHDETVTQEQFRDAILDAEIDDNIRTFILRGETGSGKSQLCQWLDYELQGHGELEEVDDRIPLHIKANETNLEQIIETLAEPLGIDPGVDQVANLSAEKVANAIVSNLEANPGDALSDVALDPIIDPDRGALKSLLTKNIEEYQESVASDDIEEFDPNLISNEDFRDLALKMGTDSVFHRDRETLRSALRDEIHRHFSHVVGVEDFEGQLKEYTQKYIDELGKRPVIICEDVTTFSVLKEQLLDQIIQVESASYDIVLGYTTGFEQDDLDDALAGRETDEPLSYLKDRAEGYLSLTENGEALFIDDSLAVDLVRKYLDVIKAESDTGVDEGLERAFDGIYPFNRPLVMQAWDNLVEDGSPRKTPRVLLQKVIKSCLLSSRAPHETLDRNPNVGDLPTKIDAASYDSDLRLLATWYGVHTGEDVLVPSDVLDSFGYDSAAVGEATEVDDDGRRFTVFDPDEFADSDPDRYLNPVDSGAVGEGGSAEDDEDESDDSGGAETSGGGTTGTPGTTGGGTTGGGPSTDTGGSDLTQEELDRRRYQKELLDWVETGEEYPSANRLRSGADDVLESWYDPTRLGNPNASTRGKKGIYYTRGSDVPVSVQGADERNGLSVMLEFGKQNLELYRTLFQYNEQGELPDGANAEQLRSWATDATSGLRADIRSELEGCLPDGMTLEHFLVFAKYLVLNANVGTVDLDREAVFADSTEDRGYDHPFLNTDNRQHPLTEAMTRLQNRRSDIDGLIEGFFLLKENLVDHDRLHPVQREVAQNPEQYLELAQKIDTEGLENPGAYGIGSTRSKAGRQADVTELFDAVSDYAVEVAMLTEDEVVDQMASDLDPIEQWYDASHTVSDLTDAYETLRECLGVFEVSEKEQWESVHEELTDPDSTTGLKAFREDAEQFLDHETSTPFDRLALLHRFQESRETNSMWDVYAALDEMIETLQAQEVGEDTDLRERLRDLDVLETFESKRAAINKAADIN